MAKDRFPIFAATAAKPLPPLMMVSQRDSSPRSNIASAGRDNGATGRRVVAGIAPVPPQSSVMSAASWPKTITWRPSARFVSMRSRVTGAGITLSENVLNVRNLPHSTSPPRRCSATLPGST